MKRIVLIIVAAVAALSVCGCMAAPVSAPEAAPEPTPEIGGIKKVYGADTLTIAAWGGSEEFLLGAGAQAEKLGIELVEVEDADAANGCGAALTYCIGDIAGLNIPVVEVTTDEGFLYENGAGIFLDETASLTMAENALLHYDNHCTPIRTIGLFTAEDSAAATSFEQMRLDGSLMVKGICFEADGAAIAELINGITVGLLDTVFAENEELAMLAYDALKENYRNDTVEVITPALSTDIVRAMMEDHYLMGAAVGINEYSAGALAVRMAAALLAGESVEDVTVEPVTVYSSDIYKFAFDKDEEIESYIRGLSVETDKLYTDGAVEYLSGFYS